MIFFKREKNLQTRNIEIKSTNNTEYAMQGSAVSFYISNSEKSYGGGYAIIEMQFSAKDNIEIVSDNSFLILERDYDFTVEVDVKYKNTSKVFKYETFRQEKNPDNTLILINKVTKIDEGYVPKLEYIFGRRLNPIVVPPLCEMFKAAISDGIYIYLDSAYRSYAMQRDIYDRYVQKYGQDQRYAAMPGESEHHSGLSVDILWGGPSSDENRRKSDEFKWLEKNCMKFGFVLRYPFNFEKITKYNFEPWHFRYVGRQAAKDFYQSGCAVLEEFLSYYGRNI